MSSQTPKKDKMKAKIIDCPKTYILERSMPEPNSGCWLWVGSTKGKGKLKSYGNVCFGTGKNISAHRFSYAAFNGQIPKDAWVLHRCDTPSCVNPDHLFLGDRAANAADRKMKNRGYLDNGKRSGEKHPRTNLTWEIVRQIRKLYQPYKITCPMLAKQFNIGVSAVELIVNNYSWKE
jgi:HNH endonuclease